MGATSRTRLHVVTGKGGTGKTTAAAALALHLASGGRRVLLIEVEGRQGIAQLFDVPQLPYEERKVAIARGSGDVYALAIDPEDALYEYLDLYYRLGRAGKALRKVGVVEFATTVAPGVRDVLLTGKAFEATRRRDGQQYAYDAVVVDAPPTGRIGRFLNVNAEVAGLAKVGPIRRQADAIMGLLRSPRTAVHIVTLLEEMPVQETATPSPSCADSTCPSAPSSSTRPAAPRCAAPSCRRRGKGPLDATEIAAGLKAAGLDRPRRAARGADPRGGQPRRAGPARAVRATTGHRTRPTGGRAALAGRRRRPRRSVRAERPAGADARARCRGDDRCHSTSTRCSTTPRPRIIVCCGAGGVGKTTTAASLGVRAAQRGRRVCVLTIDPARRLAQSLGLEELDNTPRAIAGVGQDGGALFAMMLDMKRTFDEIVQQHADPVRAAADPGEPPLPVAVQLASPGRRSTWRWRSSASCTARPIETGEWDLVIVDTPPSRSALDFLDAPARLGVFLDGRFIRILLAPARAGGKAYMKVFGGAFTLGDRVTEQDARRPAAQRPADLGGRARLGLRRVPGTRRAHLRPAPGPGDGLPRRGCPRDRCAARGVLLRRAAAAGLDAARRSGAEPRPHHRGSGRLSSARRGRRRGPRRDRGASR